MEAAPKQAVVDTKQVVVVLQSGAEAASGGPVVVPRVPVPKEHSVDPRLMVVDMEKANSSGSK